MVWGKTLDLELCQVTLGFHELKPGPDVLCDDTKNELFNSLTHCVYLRLVWLPQASAFLSFTFKHTFQSSKPVRL